jgi:hypothetical protein
MAGIQHETALTDVLDVLTVLVIETPGDALKQWRDGMDRAMAVDAARVARAAETDAEARRRMRASWGLLPGQIEQHAKFLARMGGEPGGQGAG